MQQAIETSNSRVKTDKRDSLKIAAHLAEGKLRSVYIPTVEKEDNRTVTRLRDTICKERSRIGNQIKSLLFLHGLIPADNKKKVSQKWIEGLSKFEMLPGVRFAVEKFAELWLEFNAKIKEIDIEIKKQSLEESESAIDAVYQSARGIGPTSPRVLANELGDLQHFKNERLQLPPYILFFLLFPALTDPKLAYSTKVSSRGAFLVVVLSLVLWLLFLSPSQKEEALWP